jgi:hypothetical protein
MYLIEIRFGAGQDNREGQIKGECGEGDDGQAEIAPFAFYFRFHLLGVVHLVDSRTHHFCFTPEITFPARRLLSGLFSVLKLICSSQLNNSYEHI